MDKPFDFMITDQDIGTGTARIYDTAHRVSSRAIVLSKDLKYVYLVRMHDRECYVFPGGAIEDGETTEQACVREVSEETGIICSHLLYIGHTVEHKRDLSFCHSAFWYFAYEAEISHTDFTDNETHLKMSMSKIPIEKVRELLENSYSTVRDYKEKFIQYRDLRVWETIMSNSLINQYSNTCV